MDYEKKIDIPFGAKDSELKGWEFTIPEGFTAEIKDGKVIVREKESEDERMRKMLIERVRSAEELTDELREWILAYLEKQKEPENVSASTMIPSCWETEQKERSPLTKEDEYILNRIIEHLEDEGYHSEWVELLQDIHNLLYQKERKPKMTPKWLYRLEFRDSSCGLWYDGYGKWCFESGIGSISGCKTKTLPMDYDARYKQDGRDWFSSCSRKEDLMHWYSLEDAKELISKGFVFTRYLATEYHEYEQQTVFIKETALYREEIDIFELFGQKPVEWSEEDEERIQSILFSIGYCKDEYPNKKDYSKDIDWLKSLRPQPKKNNMITPNKEFFQWIYDRLVNVHNEDPNMDYMISFKRRIEELPVDAPFWKPSEEQMEALRSVLEHEAERVGTSKYLEKANFLYEQLQKLI